MLEDCLGVSTKSGKVVSAELLCGGSVAWGKGMLVRELPAEVGYTARLGWVEVKLEPLMAGTEVVDLKAPVALITFVAEFTRSILEHDLSCELRESIIGSSLSSRLSRDSLVSRVIRRPGHAV